jgi:hypothetical protein
MILSSAMFVSRRGPFFAAFSSSASASSLFSISSRASSLLGSNHRLGGGGGDIHKNDTAAIGRCRYKHSERQINRLFRKHPARARVDARLGIERQKESVEEISSKKPNYEAVFHEAKILPNGWSKPPPDDFQRPQYPFSLSRTKNKPNNAVGYLPVYAKFRYVYRCATNARVEEKYMAKIRVSWLSSFHTSHRFSCIRVYWLLGV